MKLTEDEDMKKWMNGLVYGIVEFELKMQDDLLQTLGYINNNQITATDVTLEYIDSMKTMLKNNDDYSKLHKIIAFMAPCPWTYYEIAINIKNENKHQKDASVLKWVDFYSSLESKQQVDFIIHLINDISKDLTQDEKSEMKSYFNKACKHELDFWNAAYGHKLI